MHAPPTRARARTQTQFRFGRHSDRNPRAGCEVVVEVGRKGNEVIVYANRYYSDILRRGRLRKRRGRGFCEVTHSGGGEM